jgi:DNA adenine methylase
MTPPTRPVLRYHGGKWRLAPWILTFFPPHRVYVEPYGGGASVLLRKSRSYAEIYNDLDREVVNVFRVLRDPATASDLRRRLELTPFSRDEFVAAHSRDTDDQVELARRAIARSFMGFGSASLHAPNPRGMRTRASQWEKGCRGGTGFRSTSNRSGTTPAHDWGNWPAIIPAFVERLAGVVIEHREALEVIAQHDRPDTLCYVDPPYPTSTRDDARADYSHEMTDEQHRLLGAVLRGVRGMVVLSCYPCELYDFELYAGWERHERPHLADGARPRTEVVWLNPAASAALRQSRDQMELA